MSLSYLELEPRRQRDEGINLFVNLGATREDHGEVMP
jgi:transcription initiation factor TFIIH subunit 1